MLGFYGVRLHRLAHQTVPNNQSNSTPWSHLGYTVYLVSPIAWATFCRITKDELPERLYSLSGNYL